MKIGFVTNFIVLYLSAVEGGDVLAGMVRRPLAYMI